MTRLTREKLQPLIELADCSTATRNQLLDAIRKERPIGKFKPDGEVRVDPRDGMPIVYSMARARRPHDHLPPEADGAQTRDASDCPVCQGKTTRVLDVADAGPGFTFINKNLFPIVYPGKRQAEDVYGRRAIAAPLPADGGHFLQWTSDRHDIDLHNASVAHVEVVLSRLAAFEGALLRSGTRLPAVHSRGEQLHGYVGIIKNRGRAVGGSLVHGHQQICHTNVRPLRTAEHMEFLAREGRSVARFVLDDGPPELVLADYGAAVLVTPYFLRRALQAFVVVKDTGKDYLHQLNKREIKALAKGVRTMCAAATELMPRLGREVAYNLLVHNGPIGGCYVELVPWTQQYGGYEQLGLFIVQGTPEYSHELMADWITAQA